MTSTLERSRQRAPRAAAGRPVCFVSWGAVAGRSEEIAAAIGGEARCFFPPGPKRRPPVLLRWLLSAIGTVGYLLARRPRAIIVTNPPVFAALVAGACARVLGVPLIVDSHPGGFGVQGDRVAARLQALHRFVVRRSALVLVTEVGWAEVVGSWGASAAILHEAPGEWRGTKPVRHRNLEVLVVGRLAADEPVWVVLDAARARPECDFVVTGDPDRLPADVVASAPANVTFVGFLAAADYRAAVEGCDAVLTLTTEPSSVMRAAYEAVYALRPLVLSDWPVARQLFPHALYAANDGAAIAGAIAALDTDYEAHVRRLDDARRCQLDRWDLQRDRLLAATGAPDRTSGA
jgi:hypothetical protein